jgi:bacillithiol biosynthesis cysteine-adding enzyme BshC
MPSVPRGFESSYLAGEAIARTFIPLDFRSGADRIRRTRAAARRAPAPALVSELRAQQAALAPSPAGAANLDALAAGEAAAVVTGQQVGLFLGPLYGLYKAASAIAVARALTAEAGVRCVPVFWLQTEDHDYAEIATATVAGPGGQPVRLSLPPEPAQEARTSIAHRRLPPEIDAPLDALAELLGAGPAAQETMTLLRTHYRAGAGLAGAFAAVLAALFAEEGLLVLDPRVPAVAALATPIYREALVGAEAIERRLDERSTALVEAGFDPQIPTRAGCSLVFGHRGGATGPRYRLERPTDPTAASARWRLAGSDDGLTWQELAAALESDPLRFSTSALLRPLVQDTLLPTAAYVGGPAEVRYFAQLQPLYDHFGLTMPLVVPRARFRCLDPHTRRRLAELGCSADEVERMTGTVPGLSVARPPGVPSPADLDERIARQIAPIVDQIAATVAALDPRDRNLGRAAERTRAHVARALERLTARFGRKLAERDGATAARLERVRLALAPEGIPQERAYAWPSLAGRIGPATLKILILDRLATDPYPTTLQDLEP